MNNHSTVVTIFPSFPSLSKKKKKKKSVTNQKTETVTFDIAQYK